MHLNKVNIIIPLYNGEKYIEETLCNIVKQSYHNWEAIIIDDGSTDNSVDIVRTFVLKDARIKLFHRPENRPKGGNSCRNYGIEKATGEFIFFADADDLLAPYCLEQRIKFLKENPEIDFAVFPAITFEKEPLDSDYFYGINIHKHALHGFVNRELPFVVWNNLYRRESLTENNIHWDEKLKSNQDADFNISCLLAHLNFKEAKGLPADYFYRVGNPNSCAAKIPTHSHLDSNLYYFNKIYNLFYSKKEFKEDVKLASLFLFKKLINSSISDMNEYLSVDFFKKENNLKHQYQRIYNILNSPCNKHEIRVLLKYIPLLELKYRKLHYQFPFNYNDPHYNQTLYDITRISLYTNETLKM